MKIPALPFTAVDWTAVEPTRHPGESGFALWRTRMIGDIRVRLVEYSPGYVADHWCDRGHIIHVVSGALVSELKDGRRHELTAGMSYMVSDFGDAAHRSVTETGCTLFIVD
ncbi:DHCW motif cupin fold protein [Roseomonas marmotae]|uniref:DHCW motif cupin fold protein n=1 Tax=Roseomonas marmotae TaxID=2768161 RepID=A0ABS3KAR8_9PROT|nr:DHCW motif cupin fold protein [Roseomonas marmotae]MBO1073743.1 DHCW motif cupin fold protein [Roseomonas marmotae]QTI78625.1 DHCW motif cupin fold protein [Roseomonas marmotae]